MGQSGQRRWDCMGLSQMLGRTWTKRWSGQAFPDSFLKLSLTSLESGQEDMVARTHTIRS